MKPRTTSRGIILGLILLAFYSCTGFSYSSTGRAWTVYAEAAIDSDPIRARRAVTFSASGRLETGMVTASVYRDGLMIGPPIIIPGESVDLDVEYAFEEGLWTFSARADEEARGELYLSISDR